jgi:uncharacterized protein
MQEKVTALHQQLDAHAPLVIAYSGGVDSAYLLAAAHGLLGSRVLGVIADSPSLPREALREAVALAQQIGASIEVVRTSELEKSGVCQQSGESLLFLQSGTFHSAGSAGGGAGLPCHRIRGEC